MSETGISVILNAENDIDLLTAGLLPSCCMTYSANFCFAKACNYFLPMKDTKRAGPYQVPLFIGGNPPV
jgi:hypothetical protein